MTDPSQERNIASTADLTGKAVAGVAWSIGLSALGWPLSFFSTLVVSRASSEFFGFLTYLNMCILMITTLFLFGGVQVLIYFFPKFSPAARKRLLFEYGAVALLTALLGLAVILTFPWLRRVLGIEDHFPVVRIFLMIAVPLEVIKILTQGALRGFMHLAASEKFSGLPMLALRLVIITAFFFFPDFASIHYVIIFMIVIISAQVATVVSSISLLVRNWPREKAQINEPVLLRRDLWGYALFLHLNTVSTFVFQQGDRWIALSVFGLEGLAAYAIGASLAEYVRLIPITISLAVFPLFSHLFAANRSDSSRRTYRASVLINSMIAYPFAMIYVCFAPEIIRLMGKDYTVLSQHVLVVLSIVLVLSSISSINAAYLMGAGHSRFMFVVAFIGGCVQLGLSYVFLHFGGSAVYIAWARAASMVVMVSCTTWKSLRLMPGCVPWAFFLGLGGIILAAAAANMTGWAVPARAALFAAILSTLIIMTLYQFEPDLRALFFSPRKMFAYLKGK